MRKIIITFLAAFYCLGVTQSSPGGQDPISEVNRLNALVSQLYVDKRFDEALVTARKVLELSEKRLGPEHDLSITALNNLAQIYLAIGKIDEAEQRYRKALKICEKKQGADPLKVADLLDSLASIEQHIHRDFDKAKALYFRALTIREKAFGSQHDYVLLSISNLIDANMADRDYKTAEPLLQRFISTSEKRQDLTNKLAEALQSYEYLLRREKRQAEAQETESRLSTLLLKSIDKTFPIILSDEMIVCRAIDLVLPDYPVIDTLGFVSILVDVVIDGKGKVSEARATGTPNSFALASIRAAKDSVFLPLVYDGQPVRYSGSITYKFRKYRVAPETFNEPLGAEIKSRRCVPIITFRPS
jgi:tetratricopeptide (TPR) repeat protein